MNPGMPGVVYEDGGMRMSRKPFAIMNRLAAAALVLGTLVPGALAQVVDAAVEEQIAGERLTWQMMVQHGGILMYVLIGMSVLTVTLIVYLLLVLRRGQVAPLSLRRVVMEGIRSGAMDDVRRACDYRRCALAAVVLSALNYLRDVPEADNDMIREVIQGEGMRQAESLQGQTQFLLDIAVIAPMVGLLGTVLGMLQAFSGVAHELAKAKPVALASGVSMALITTACGLIVGIPAMACYAFFRRRASRLTSELESASTDVMAALHNKGAE